jgi:hypothetical protein
MDGDISGSIPYCRLFRQLSRAGWNIKRGRKMI